MNEIKVKLELTDEEANIVYEALDALMDAWWVKKKYVKSIAEPILKDMKKQFPEIEEV